MGVWASITETLLYGQMPNHSTIIQKTGVSTSSNLWELDLMSNETSQLKCPSICIGTSSPIRVQFTGFFSWPVEENLQLRLMELMNSSVRHFAPCIGPEYVAWDSRFYDASCQSKEQLWVVWKWDPGCLNPQAVVAKNYTVSLWSVRPDIIALQPNKEHLHLLLQIIWLSPLYQWYYPSFFMFVERAF